jgi:hypothetical protein
MRTGCADPQARNTNDLVTRSSPFLSCLRASLAATDIMPTSGSCRVTDLARPVLASEVSRQDPSELERKSSRGHEDRASPHCVVAHWSEVQSTACQPQRR